MQQVVELRASRRSVGHLVMVENQDYSVGSDESTRGIGSGTDKRMMRLFSGLAVAGDGKTLVCVNHGFGNIAHCQLVSWCPDGHTPGYKRVWQEKNPA